MWGNTWNFPQPSQVNTTRWFISGDPYSTAKRASKAKQLKQFRRDSHKEQADTTGEDTCVLVQPLEPRWDVLTCFKKHYTPTLGKQSETTPVSLPGRGSWTVFWPPQPWMNLDILTHLNLSILNWSQIPPETCKVPMSDNRTVTSDSFHLQWMRCFRNTVLQSSSQCFCEDELNLNYIQKCPLFSVEGENTTSQGKRNPTEDAQISRDDHSN